ncbi:MAG: hypothetical protein LQ337_000947 [Flavoplaca oasis]|nr:MAG: hypothetical protein LQ337_000947 [Flavoplaca oasis]
MLIKKIAEEEKAEAKAKKEEEKAKKAEAKRFREEDKQKSKGPQVVDADEEGRPTTSSEPPVLDPIPSVEPINAEDDDLRRPRLRTTVTEEIKMQVEEEKRASMLAQGPTTTDDDQTTAISYTGPLDVSKVAERVFSSPVGDPAEEVTTKPQASKTSAMEPMTTAEPIVTKPAPMATKEANPVATTETTVTGPSSSSQKQAKDEGKISSWLKNKLRRSSKPSKPEISKTGAPEVSGNEKGFVGGASLGNQTSASKSSTNPSNEDSIREVAMVGKPQTSATSGPVTTPAIAPSNMGSDTHDDDELYAASTKEHQKQRSHSSSPVSSLSSDEGEHPRGRSQLRREVTGSDGNGEDEFEEARDHFETSRLSPPAPLKDTAGRVSDSPVRDSKFSEAL